jgi:hypothetical protein
MNYELALCFLFILLFIIYFYIRKQPILEGAGKKKTTDPFKKFGKQITNDIKKKLLAPIKKLFKPITDGIKKMKTFFVNLGKYNADWIKLIGNSFKCAFTNVTDPFCLLLNVVRLFGLMLYGFGWILFSIFGKHNTYECTILRVQDFLWKYLMPQMLKKKINKCYGKCNGQIPVFGGKPKKKNPNKALNKCLKDESNVSVEESFISTKTFFFITAMFLAIYIGYEELIASNTNSKILLSETNKTNPM